MRTPKWLIPVIAIIAGLAVGVAAAFVGAQLSAPGPVTPPSIEAVPILGPTSVDGVATSTDPNEDSFGASPIIGSGQIAVPGSGEAGLVDADIQARVDALNAAAGTEPGEAETALDDLGPLTPAGADDPCSPADGSEPPADCPADGLMGAIFADTLPPRFWLALFFHPPVSSADGLAFCPTESLGDGDLPIGVATGRPSDVHVTFWPIGHADRAQTIELDGDPDDATSWNDTFASTGSYPEHPNYQHCGAIPGLVAGTVYTASAYATDVMGATSDTSTYTFTRDGGPTEPPLTVVPLSGDLVYVSAPMQSDIHPPIVRAWVPAPGAPTDCSGADAAAYELQPIGFFNTIPVPAGYNIAHNYEASWDHRLTGVFAAPEGSTIVVCARWFPAGGPSWSRGNPTRQASMVLTSPDLYTPIVTLTKVGTVRDVAAGAIKLQASSQAGFECGAQAYLPAIHADASVDFDTRLCEAGQRGLAGNITINSIVDLSTGEFTSRYLLPLARYSRCGGPTCAAPPELTFDIPLPTVQSGVGLCGSSFGECTPPGYDTDLGTARVTVTWDAGNTNGADAWVVGSPDETLPDVPRPDAPQMDTSQEVSVHTSPDGWSADGSFTLTADRPAHYTVTVAGDCFAPGFDPEISGDTSIRGTTVQIFDLCPGSSYTLTVTLVDAAGASATYSPGSAPTPWYGGRVVVPAENTTITGTVTITQINGFARPWGTFGTDVTVGNDPRYTHGVTFDDSCYPATQHSSSQSFDSITVIRTHVMHVRLLTVVAREGLYSGRDYDATCGWPNPFSQSSTIDTDVTWEQLAAGVRLGEDIPIGLTGGSDEFHVEYTLRATRG